MAVLAAFLFALIIMALVIEMVRRKRLREKYAVLWLLVGTSALVLAGFPRLLAIVAGWLGVQVPSNLLFAMSIVLLLGVCLHLSWELSVVEDETRILAEEVAIIRAIIDRRPDHCPSHTDDTSSNSCGQEPADASDACRDECNSKTGRDN